MANPIKQIRTKAGIGSGKSTVESTTQDPSRPQFKTKEQAETALAEMIASRGAGLEPVRRDVTFEMQAESFSKRMPTRWLARRCAVTPATSRFAFCLASASARLSISRRE